METETTNEVNLNPDTPEHPVTHLETQRKTAVTPLDMNRFQSKAFRTVMSQHSGQASVSPSPGQSLQKEPSLHLDTPSKFLSKDKLFKPSFDVKVRLIENGSRDNSFTTPLAKDRVGGAGAAPEAQHRPLRPPLNLEGVSGGARRWTQSTASALQPPGVGRGERGPRPQLSPRSRFLSCHGRESGLGLT